MYTRILTKNAHLLCILLQVHRTGYGIAGCVAAVATYADTCSRIGMSDTESISGSDGSEQIETGQISAASHADTNEFQSSTFQDRQQNPSKRARTSDAASERSTVLSTQEDVHAAHTKVLDAVRLQLDMVTLMACPSGRDTANALIQCLDTFMANISTDNPQIPTTCTTDTISTSVTLDTSSSVESKDINSTCHTPIKHDTGIKHAVAVQIVEHLPLHKFLQNYMDLSQPVIIQGSIEHWPAMRKWSDMAYLKTSAGARTVPVEVRDTILVFE